MIDDSSAAPVEVSVIVPVFNDAAWVARAIESCLAQTLGAIEIIVVDDASTDETTTIVQGFQRRDSRIRLITMRNNGSALQARRVGLDNATADFVMFLDGDDELVPEACARAVHAARVTGADLIGFGSVVVSADGTTGSNYEKSMQPVHRELHGEDVLARLFPAGQNAQGQLWRYLFHRSLLDAAYRDLPPSLVLPRMNDLPIAFLALMRAKHYVSMKDTLYRYFFHRGSSGHQITTWSDYLFNASALDSINSISLAVANEAKARSENSELLNIYASVRSSVNGRVLNYVSRIADEELQSQAVSDLIDRVGHFELAIACSDYCRGALPMLIKAYAPPPLARNRPSHVILRTGNLRTGGVQGVLVAQAGILRRAGVDVTVVVDSDPVSAYDLPEDVELLQIQGKTHGERISYLAGLCSDRGVDAVIDHHIFYNDRWPFYAYALGVLGVPTIGWIHNFAMRPLLDEVSRLSFLDTYLPILNTVVVLSEPDVAYWKLRGLPNVVYLPNPTSQLVDVVEGRPLIERRPSSQLRIIWWGRLQQRTKQVLDLVDVGAQLQALGVDFELTIVGPDGPDLKSENIKRRARQRGVLDKVNLLGELHGEDMVRVAEAAHVFVSTSIVEGYPLALVEAQALALPIVMYDLPWLEFIRGNSGVISVSQGDQFAMAKALMSLLEEPKAYDAMVSGAVQAAEAESSFDLEDVYLKLLQGTLGPEFSPDPSEESIRVLFDHNIRFVERLVRVHGRELKRQSDRLGRQIRDLEARVNKSSGSVKGASVTKRAAPVVPAVKAWLQRFLPPTMRQAAYYARHEYSIASRQHDELLSNQAALSAQLSNIEAQLSRKH